MIEMAQSKDETLGCQPVYIITALAPSSNSYMQVLNVVRDHSTEAIGSLLEIENTKLNSNEMGYIDLV